MGNEKVRRKSHFIPMNIGHTYNCIHKKTYLVGPDKLYKRSLDSAVSSLLALINVYMYMCYVYIAMCYAHVFPCT